MPRVLAALLLLICSACWCCAEEANVPLRTSLPQEVLAGTPPDLLATLHPEWELPLPNKQREFLVPKGTVNVALKQKVASSDANPILGQLALVTDGGKEGGEENYVELGPMKQWVQIDLGKPCRVYAIYVWHYFREARSYEDVIVQVADDPQFAKDVHTIYNNDQDNSSRLGVGKDRPYIETNFGKLIDAKGQQGRYVRLYSKGNTANDLNHYVEVEVFGKPLASQPVGGS